MINNQSIVHECKHASNWNDRWMMRLVERPLKRNIIVLKIKKVIVDNLYFAPLQFSKQEWSELPK